MKRFMKRFDYQGARSIIDAAAANAGRQEAQEPPPAAQLAVSNDANRLVRAVKARCLQNYGCYLESGVPIRADGTVVAPGSFAETAGSLGSHLNGGGDALTSIQQQADNPNRLADAVRRRLLASGRMVAAT